MAGGAQFLKRIPRIKFPQRHPKPADSCCEGKASGSNEALRRIMTRPGASGSSTLSASGKASLQPKRTPLSNEEIEAVLMGGCV